VELLDQIFSDFDRLASHHGLEKIKTIGDAYMVVGGLPTPRDDHADAIANMALDMQIAIANFNNYNNLPRLNGELSMRIGIFSPDMSQVHSTLQSSFVLMLSLSLPLFLSI
jgi:class 3 adenylate cyclase